MAHEQLMGQAWANCADDIPTTDPELPLTNLDISDPEHPILRKQEAPKGNTEAAEPDSVPADSSPSPDGGSSCSDSASLLSERISTSSFTTVSDGSWTLDVRTAIMNVSGQFSVQESEPSDAGGDTMDAVEAGGQAVAIP